MPSHPHPPEPGHIFKAGEPPPAAVPLCVLATCLVCLTLLAWPSPARADWELTYLTEEYYPFNYTEHGVLKGVSVDILRQVWGELGEPEHPIHIMPWARAYDRALNVHNTVLFSMARIVRRENLFRWAGPIAVTRFVLVAKKSANIALSTLEDAEGYRIGTLRDDISDTLLKKYTERNKIEAVADMRHNIRKLIDNRLDMVAYEESSWRQIAIKNGLSPDDYETVFVLRETPVFYAFHRDTPSVVVRDFQEALDRVKATDRYQAILEAYLR
ncbi:MAG: transporter substrate-binding domain-containing protein [Desulfovibrionaceae bacterium]|nr:transporter substrate-binding domain-containing protein [Desulfovibrionaceae bacterium]